MKNTKIIAIDHGNSNIKTINHVFTAGFAECGHLPTRGQDVLIYEGVEYALVSRQVEQRFDKTKDDDYFILTLFAIGKELLPDIRLLEDLSRNEPTSIDLVAGLPPAHIREMKERFINYLSRGEVKFTYNNVNLFIKIDNVTVMPQALSAIGTIAKDLTDEYYVNVVDIGGGTVDCLMLGENFKLELLSIKSFNEYGTNSLYERINEKIRASLAREMPIAIIEKILTSDMKAVASVTKERLELIQNEAEKFAKSLIISLEKGSLNIAEYPTVFIGGGAILLKQAIEKSGLVERPIFIDDIKANVKGFYSLFKGKKAGD